MEAKRILSFATSHKVNESQLNEITAGSQMNFSVETTVDPKTGDRTISFDSRG
jgi:hypothetical protein